MKVEVLKGHILRPTQPTAHGPTSFAVGEVKEVLL